MKLSLATRIFLGYAVVLVTFGAVSLFSVAELHSSRQLIRLVSQGYLELSQDAAGLEAFHANQQRDIERLLQAESAVTRRNLITLARLSYLPLVDERLAAARARARDLVTLAPDGDAPFARELADRFGALGERHHAYAAATNGLFRLLSSETPDAAALQRATAELRTQSTAFGRDVLRLRAELDEQLRERVDHAERRAQRASLAIVGLSLFAVAVGLLVTGLSARALRPVRTLIEGVSRIGRGDYTAQLGVRGEDEVAVLAREFDAMAKSLQARERQLRAQAEVLLRTEQLAAVGRISAQIAHEVRNPLSSIGLNAELLSEALGRARFASPEEAGEAQTLLAAVSREVDRLAEVTEGYLRMARSPSPTLAPEDVAELVDAVLAFAREELERAGVQVERAFDPATPPALADEAQLRQVLLNLLRNSREAMPHGGRLRVAVRPGEPDAVEVEVRDTGAGMPEAVRARLFEPFFTTKEGGTGLGLAVSQQILQAHGGSLRCHSEPGRGTSFVLRLPRAP